MRSVALLTTLVTAVLAAPSVSAGVLVAPRQASSAASAAGSAVASATEMASSATDSAASSGSTATGSVSSGSSSASGTASSSAAAISASAPAMASPAALPTFGQTNLSSTFFNSSVAGPDGLNNANCQDLTLQVTVDAENVQYTDAVDNSYNNQSYITQEAMNLANFQMQWIASRANGTAPNTNTYSIHASYCTPQKNSNPSNNASLIVAAHGIGFNHRYWDFRPNNTEEYSFVRHATSNGYSVFTYDRLGTGQSSHPGGGFNETQAATEVSVLAGILTQLRNGTAVQGRKFGRIVGIGHSYGSVQMQALTANDPDLLDGVVLTGYSNSSASLSEFILASTLTPGNQVMPQRFGNLSDVYLVDGSAAATSTLFAWPGNADPNALSVAQNEYSDAVTLGALTTIGTVTKPADGFTKPVFVITGQRDLPFCANDCTAPLLDGVGQMLYPQSSNFTSYVVPETGHGLVAHYTAPDSNKRIIDFVKSVDGISSSSGSSNDGGDNSSSSSSAASTPSSTGAVASATDAAASGASSATDAAASATSSA